MESLSLRPVQLAELEALHVALPPADMPAQRRPPQRGQRLSVIPRPSIAPGTLQRLRAARGRPRSERAPVVVRPEPTEAPVRASELLALYSPVVRQIAGGFQRKLPRNVLRDDLIGAGMSGLWDAIRKHGADPGDGFEWYVRVRIRGAILDELRAQDWLPRRARVAVNDRDDGVPLSVVRIEDVSGWEQARCLTAGEATSTEAIVERKSVREALQVAIEKLPEREQYIVSKHYFDDVKFKDLGAELGVSEPRISQLHSRAMQRLRGMMDEAA